MKKPTPNSSFGMTSPQPASQWTGFFGLCSHSWRWVDSMSNLTCAVQPYDALSQAICSLDKRLRSIRGTGFSWLGVMGFLSTGHVGCLVNHSVIHAPQNACSHWGAYMSHVKRKLQLICCTTCNSELNKHGFNLSKLQFFNIRYFECSLFTTFWSVNFSS